MRHLVVIALLLAAGPATAAPQPLAPATQAAWAKVGAEATWFGRGPDLRYTMAHSPDGLTDPIVYFWFPSPRKDEIRWDRLPDPKVPFGVMLGNTPATDATLAQLKGFPSLAAVDLFGTAVTDRGLEALVAFPRLVHVTLDFHTITPAGLDHLRMLPGLRSLCLTGPKATDETLKALPGLDRLTSLDLVYSAVTDDGLKHLAGLKQLAALDVSRTKVTGRGLAALPGLAAVSVGPNAVLEPLAGLKSLTCLRLEGYPKLRTLPELPAVRRLTLNVADDGEDDLAVLSRVPALTHLQLTGPLSDAGAEHVRRAPRLRGVTLNQTKLTDAGLAPLVALPELEELTLSHAKVTNEGMAHVAGMKSLRALDLHFTRVTPTGLGRLAGLERLTSLSVEYSTPPISDASLDQLKRLRHLTFLQLGGATITDAGLEHLAEMRHLRQLRLTGRYTPAGVTKLRAALPDCDIAP